MMEGNLQHSFHAFEPFSFGTSFVRKGKGLLFVTYYYVSAMFFLLCTKLLTHTSDLASYARNLQNTLANLNVQLTPNHSSIPLFLPTLLNY
jgi:hypothetical protein